MLDYDVEILKNELNSLLSQIKDELHRISRAKRSSSQAKVNRCSDLLQNFRTARDTYRLELKAVDDPKIKAAYEQDLEDLNKLYNICSTELETIKLALNRDKFNIESQDGDKSPEHGSTQQVQLRGDQLQEKTQEAVERMKKMADESEAIGLSTVNRMDAQIERMDCLAKGFDDIAYNTNRAKKTAQTLLRNASGDPCIRILSVTLVISIVILIALLATR